MGTQRVKTYQEKQEEKAIKKTREEIDSEEAPSKGANKLVQTAKPSRPKRQRSKKWLKAKELVISQKEYPLDEAIRLVKKTSYAQFDARVEMHIRLKPKKGQVVRGVLALPHGTGKEVRVAIFDDKILATIEKGQIDFDVLVARPNDLPKLAKVAKILGPRGLMPNAKSGTITNEPEKLIEQIKKGQIEFKTDSGNNLHLAIGRVSWEEKKLTENFEVVYNAIRQYSPLTVYLSATMGPSIKIKI